MHSLEDRAGKGRAFAFLRELERTLNNGLPRPTEMESWIRRTVAAAKLDERQTHLRLPEAAFLNGKVLPMVADLIQSYSGLSAEQARLALLGEYRALRNIAAYSPVRWERHPFTKTIGSNATTIYQDWKKGRLAQSWPDFALRDPFPHSILFEGKYLPRRGTSQEYAQKQLVALIYQAFFYRGLPHLASTPKHPIGWGYEYACLLAYDASPKETLRSAWKNLHRDVRRAFWDGANLYIMILTGAKGEPEKLQ